MPDQLRYLLLQVRNADDPMREQEVTCFATALNCSIDQIRIYDLLSGVPTLAELREVDIVFLGGSGDYSVAEGGPWLPRALETMQELYEVSKPTFASCWGFQAMAKAMGGDVITDMSRAELGTLEVHLTDAGKQDPLFAALGDTFLAAMGHQDIVVELPQDAILLASTATVENQAFRFADKPIYCTQFHPELRRENLIERIYAYPQYVERITGESIEQFIARCQEMPKTQELLAGFVRHVSAAV